jgi:hypothetical protein
MSIKPARKKHVLKKPREQTTKGLLRRLRKIKRSYFLNNRNNVNENRFITVDYKESSLKFSFDKF